ncbi:MAG: hypothetical protein N4A71_11040 [Carboxylicivirga sp.]|jgi:hypothetical protein|nr:hypothetical protein [Carboxylicivirga sp.]
MSNIASKSIEAGSKLKVRSALNPLLWLCGICEVQFLALAAMIKPIPVWLIVLIMLPVCAAIVGYFVLLVIDPDKLQSEEYQLQKREMELSQEKGDKGPIEIDANDVIVVDDPKGIGQ